MRLPSPVNAVILTVLATMLTVSVPAIREEWMIHDLSTAVDRQRVRPAETLALGDSASLSPRAAALRAVILSRTTAGDAQNRGHLLAQARSDVERAVRARPLWGQAWLAACFVEIGGEGLESPDGLQSYRRSYAESPYLADAAEWRLRFAIIHWKALDPTTRKAAIDEARWYLRLARNNPVHIYVLTGGTPLWPMIWGSRRPPYVSAPRPS